MLVLGLSKTYVNRYKNIRKTLSGEMLQIGI